MKRLHIHPGKDFLLKPWKKGTVGWKAYRLACGGHSLFPCCQSLTELEMAAQHFCRQVRRSYWIFVPVKSRCLVGQKQMNMCTFHSVIKIWGGHTAVCIQVRRPILFLVPAKSRGLKRRIGTCYEECNYKGPDANHWKNWIAVVSC